jgi:energy-coupling factor transporter ATP-binding protein EcfA2
LAFVIRFNDRTLVIGKTGSGKSELINVLFSAMAGGAQRVLVDTKREFAINGVTPIVGDPEAIDWTQPVIHYVDGGGGPAEMQRLFVACHARRRIVVAVHELGDICDFNAARTPPAFNEYVSKGRALGQGLIAGTQRPFEIPLRARSEADHVYVFTPRLLPDQDVKASAQALGMRHQDLPGALDELQETLGEHSFFCRDKGGQVQAFAPLSENERAGIIVARPELY